MKICGVRGVRVISCVKVNLSISSIWGTFLDDQGRNENPKLLFQYWLLLKLGYLPVKEERQNVTPSTYLLPTSQVIPLVSSSAPCH